MYCQAEREPFVDKLDFFSGPFALLLLENLCFLAYILQTCNPCRVTTALMVTLIDPIQDNAHFSIQIAMNDFIHTLWYFHPGIVCLNHIINFNWYSSLRICCTGSTATTCHADHVRLKVIISQEYDVSIVCVPWYTLKSRKIYCRTD